MKSKKSNNLFNIENIHVNRYKSATAKGAFADFIHGPVRPFLSVKK